MRQGPSDVLLVPLLNWISQYESVSSPLQSMSATVGASAPLVPFVPSCPRQGWLSCAQYAESASLAEANSSSSEIFGAGSPFSPLSPRSPFGPGEGVTTGARHLSPAQ